MPQSTFSAGVQAVQNITIDTLKEVLRCLRSLMLLHSEINLYYTLFKFRDAKFSFHDPLAAMTIFDEYICQFATGAVEVELIDESAQGATHWHTNTQQAKHEVAVEVDKERFFNRYFSVFRE